MSIVAQSLLQALIIHIAAHTSIDYLFLYGLCTEPEVRSCSCLILVNCNLCCYISDRVASLLTAESTPARGKVHAIDVCASCYACLHLCLKRPALASKHLCSLLVERVLWIWILQQHGSQNVTAGIFILNLKSWHCTAFSLLRFPAPDRQATKKGGRLSRTSCHQLVDVII